MIIIRYGELALKGRNRNYFEQKLVSNIQLLLKKNNVSAKVSRYRGRVLIDTDKKLPFIKHIFGIISFSYTKKLDLDIDSIEKESLKLSTKIKDSFKIDTNRPNKKFPLTSMEVNQRIGKIVQEKTNAKVNLKNPRVTLGIEIADSAYIFTEYLPGLGGLPVGVEGKVYVLIQDSADILAGVLMMKRGCYIIPVAFTDKDISLLKKFDPNLKLKIIKDLKNLENPLVVGQTLDNFKNLEHSFVLRPLIAYNEEEIKDKLDFYKKV